MRSAKSPGSRPLVFAFCGAAFGLAIGIATSQGLAQIAPPTEHKGLSLVNHGVVSEQTLAATIGLKGYKMQLRAITIAPGGDIARHSHETRPGIVKVVAGEWVEGRDGGERIYASDTAEPLIEDENTVHWFFNRGDAPATALVCDIVPAS